jgi:hypothetical protein
MVSFNDDTEMIWSLTSRQERCTFYNRYTIKFADTEFKLEPTGPKCEFGNQIGALAVSPACNYVGLYDWKG